MLHIFDAFMDSFGPRLTALKFLVQAFVVRFKVAAVELRDCAELFQGRLELLLGRFLIIARTLDSIHEDLALLHSELFHRLVIHRLTSGKNQHSAQKYR